MIARALVRFPASGLLTASLFLIPVNRDSISSETPSTQNGLVQKHNRQQNLPSMIVRLRANLFVEATNESLFARINRSPESYLNRFQIPTVKTPVKA